MRQAYGTNQTVLGPNRTACNVSDKFNAQVGLFRAPEGSYNSSHGWSEAEPVVNRRKWGRSPKGANEEDMEHKHGED